VKTSKEDHKRGNLTGRSKKNPVRSEHGNPKKVRYLDALNKNDSYLQREKKKKCRDFAKRCKRPHKEGTSEMKDK